MKEWVIHCKMAIFYFLWKLAVVYTVQLPYCFLFLFCSLENLSSWMIWNQKCLHASQLRTWLTCVTSQDPAISRLRQRKQNQANQSYLLLISVTARSILLSGKNCSLNSLSISEALRFRWTSWQPVSEWYNFSLSARSPITIFFTIQKLAFTWNLGMGFQLLCGPCIFP